MLSLLIIHGFFTKLGFSFIGTEIERDGNEQLLNNLEEGVIILEADATAQAAAPAVVAAAGAQFAL